MARGLNLTRKKDQSIKLKDVNTLESIEVKYKGVYGGKVSIELMLPLENARIYIDEKEKTDVEPIILDVEDINSFGSASFRIIAPQRYKVSREDNSQEAKND